MAIEFACGCGQVLSVDEAHAGQMVQCPRCQAAVQAPAAGAGAPAQTLNYAGGGAGVPGAPIAPPPSTFVRAPVAIPPNLRGQGLPPFYLVFNTMGAAIEASFDVSPALDALAEGFAKQLKKKFDVQIVPQPPAGAPYAVVRLVHVDEGNRFLRYFLTLFAGKTVLEVDGEVLSVSGQREQFYEKHKGMGGIFGGAAINLLKMSGKYLGKKIAKKALK
jgi:hypothetical protein